MPSKQLIPADLAEIPPGPQLSAVLSGIVLARLSGFDCVQVLKARYRQLNHDRAQSMAAMVEVGLCSSAPDDLARMGIPDEFSADEVRAALLLTRRAAVRARGASQPDGLGTIVLGSLIEPSRSMVPSVHRVTSNLGGTSSPMPPGSSRGHR